ncbi:MAG TPA: hypothetical protein VF443_04760 [Nitrospira sp.]
MMQHLNALLLGQSKLMINGRYSGGTGGSGPTGSAGSAVSLFVMSNSTLNFLYQSDKYWLQDNNWGSYNLSLGAYAGSGGSTYELQVGWASPRLSISTTSQARPAKFRVRWAYPRSTNEVKAYPCLVYGDRPGYSNSWITPGGYPRVLPNDVTASDFPSGKTPLAGVPITIDSLSAGVKVYADINGWSRSCTGHSAGGHLSFDIWFQNSSDQNHGVSCPPLTHELMIPYDFWGNNNSISGAGYGQYPYRNPSWYVSDTTIQGKLWHMYYAPNFNGSWVFIVFEPDSVPLAMAGGRLEIGEFVLKARQMGFLNCLASVSGVAVDGSATHMVAIEFGVEPVDGQGDLTVSGYAITVV